MQKKSLALAKVYQLLEQGPVVLLSTADKDKANVMAMSWHMMIDFEPPLLAFVMSDENYSFKALKRTKECVINIPSAELAQLVVNVGNVSGARVDKIKKFSIATNKASVVNAPLLIDCFAHLECKVIDVTSD
jgi:flavin reductase (DIM6/NTAB) family NADH-FMN oxidoreductase RutF